MTAFFLQLLVYVMVDEDVEEEDEEMNEGLEGWMVGWQVGITWRNDRCLPTAAHCPYTSCITHIDYLPFSTLRVDSSFKSNLVPLLYCHLGGLWTFPKMIKILTYEKKKANNHATKRVKWVRFLQSLQSGNEKH